MRPNPCSANPVATAVKTWANSGSGSDTVPGNPVLNGAGVCTGDYDNDGRVDIFVVSQDGSNRLYRQVDTWKFEDVTESAGGLGGGDTWGTGASFVDVNNDGFLSAIDVLQIIANSSVTYLPLKQSQVSTNV